MRASFPAFGITRLGRVTGLDRIGIPVWMAVRPNSFNLAVSQGKGLDDIAAAVSAGMEATELALAERPHPHALTSSREDLELQGTAVLDTRRYLSLGRTAPSADQPIRWVEGLDLLANQPILVPEETVTLQDVPGLTYWQASDGLAAGGSLIEAANHAIYELIERDALGLASFAAAPEMLKRQVVLSSSSDANLLGVVTRIEAAELRLKLFELTTDLGVPTYLAVITPKHPRGAGPALSDLEVASGTGAHLTASKAALRAVLEAVQSRLTSIAGARDDIDPAGYQRAPRAHAVFYSDENPEPSATTLPTTVTAAAPAQLDVLLARLRACHIRSAVLVPFATPCADIRVVKALIPQLEQDPGTRNRRLGRRAVAAMLGQP